MAPLLTPLFLAVLLGTLVPCQGHKFVHPLSLISFHKAIVKLGECVALNTASFESSKDPYNLDHAWRKLFSYVLPHFRVCIAEQETLLLVFEYDVATCGGYQQVNFVKWTAFVWLSGVRSEFREMNHKFIDLCSSHFPNCSTYSTIPFIFCAH